MKRNALPTSTNLQLRAPIPKGSRVFQGIELLRTLTRYLELRNYGNALIKNACGCYVTPSTVTRTTTVTATSTATSTNVISTTTTRTDATVTVSQTTRVSTTLSIDETVSGPSLLISCISLTEFTGHSPCNNNDDHRNYYGEEHGNNYRGRDHHDKC